MNSKGKIKEGCDTILKLPRKLSCAKKVQKISFCGNWRKKKCINHVYITIYLTKGDLGSAQQLDTATDIKTIDTKNIKIHIYKCSIRMFHKQVPWQRWHISWDP